MGGTKQTKQQPSKSLNHSASLTTQAQTTVDTTSSKPSSPTRVPPPPPVTTWHGASRRTESGSCLTMTRCLCRRRLTSSAFLANLLTGTLHTSCCTGQSGCQREALKGWAAEVPRPQHQQQQQGWMWPQTLNSCRTFVQTC